MAKIITKNDEIIFLIDKIARNPIFLNHENVSLNDIYSAFESGELRLQTNDEDGTSVIDDTDLKEINKLIPWLFKIIEKPRSFIRTYEEKVPSRRLSESITRPFPCSAAIPTIGMIGPYLMSSLKKSSQMSPRKR